MKCYHGMTLIIRKDGAYCPRCGKLVRTKEQVIKANRDNHLFEIPEIWRRNGA
jgi:uncharacterized C2H2 Zn-finger protein